MSHELMHIVDHQCGWCGAVTRHTCPLHFVLGPQYCEHTLEQHENMGWTCDKRARDNPVPGPEELSMSCDDWDSRPGAERRVQK